MIENTSKISAEEAKKDSLEIIIPSIGFCNQNIMTLGSITQLIDFKNIIVCVRSEKILLVAVFENIATEMQCSFLNDINEIA